MGEGVCKMLSQISVPQIEYPLGGSSNKGSHAYFMLIVAMVLLHNFEMHAFCMLFAWMVFHVTLLVTIITVLYYN